MFSKNLAYNGRKWGWGCTKQNWWFISVESSLIMFASGCGGTMLKSLVTLFGDDSSVMGTGLLKFPFCWSGYIRKKG